MRKPEVAETLDIQVTQTAEIIPIRTETVLCQYPIHKLSKDRKAIQIQLTRENGRGKAETIWEVTANAKYGHPGELAYKIDTIVINRLIDDLYPDIPEVIKIADSLQQLSELIGREKTGSTTQIKNALYQNAGALVAAKLEFTGRDKTQRRFEFGSTRYGVVFTGERLPSGETADAIYLILNPLFRHLLQHAKRRPLDYEYLKKLPPTALRWYELVSFQIFAALNLGNPRARYLYSELCMRANLTRFFTWDQSKKQLYKIHRPHIESGYISKVEAEQTSDKQGRLDWVLWYTPGRKAKLEYQEFNKRPRLGGASPKPPTRPRLVGVKEQGREVMDADVTPEEKALHDRLIAYGITEAKAHELVANYRESVERELEAFPHRKLDGVENPAGLLIAAIQSGVYSQPSKVETQRAKRAAVKKAAEKRRLEEARESYRQKFLPQYVKRAMEELSRIEREHPEACGDFSEFVSKDRETAERQGLSPLMLQELIVCDADWFFNDGYWEKYGIPFPGFWDWDEKENSDRYDPA